jgi:selenocysteine lyase/cysteine desulfurase
MERDFAELRAREFGRLDARGVAYLDYTGSALYGVSQLRAHHARLERDLLGNPHSAHAPSLASTEIIDAARERVLRFLGVDATTHAVCFTANATAAIKLVAESYPFGPDRACVLSADNHNSVGGMREFARRAGGPVAWLPIAADLTLDEPTGALASISATRGLVAYPAQSNFSGARHPLSFVADAKARGFEVLLDTAAFAASHPIDLSTCQADFIALSFYKLFGYPTGVGALVARHEALATLTRPWFAGGTVLYASVQAGRHRLRPGPEAFEDGSPGFLSIAALDAGFALLEEAGMSRIHEHARGLAEALRDGLLSLRHQNGRPVVCVYGPADASARGTVVTFNVLTPRGLPVPFDAVESRAREADVAVRGGCFCNPGASEAAFGFDADRVRACFETLGESFSVEQFGTCLGADVAVGAIRASVGLANNVRDVHRAIDVAASFRR